MVDSRLLQANERTLLAWVRTSISLMTFGFVIVKIAVWLPHLNARPDLHASPRQESTWVGGVFLILGVAADIIAVTRYSLARRALLAGKEIRRRSVADGHGCAGQPVRARHQRVHVAAPESEH